MNNLIVGVDIGGTNTGFGLVGPDGVIYGSGGFKTWDYPCFEDFVVALGVGITDLVATLDGGDSRWQIVGMGIGAPNVNHNTGTIECASNLPWKGKVNLTQRLGELFVGIPIVATNDAKAAALGEMYYGVAREFKDFIVITLGTGLGSGVVVDGRLMYGHDSLAGEVGHWKVVCGGRRCNCTGQGCLETYASATGLRTTALELLATESTPSLLRGLPSESVTTHLISTLAQQGDGLAIRAFELTSEILGVALANLVALTSPEAIILMGGLSKAGDVLLAPTLNVMNSSLLPHFRGKVKLLVSTIDGRTAGILGAAAICRDERSIL